MRKINFKKIKTKIIFNFENYEKNALIIRIIYKLLFIIIKKVFYLTDGRFRFFKKLNHILFKGF